MDNMVMRHLQDLYGLNPNTPHMALQFPRLPPGLNHPLSPTHHNQMKPQLSHHNETLNQKLQGFQKLYQQYASGLISPESPIVPHGHPLFTGRNSIQTLKIENDKLIKENLELKKKLKNRPNDKHNP
ncbi:hypothetical protein OAJ58_00805 [Nitrosopumilus sp.]|nr:hypothetical protein [Nitrosopumilus sp.]MDC0205075.1 hypothetical protein [Nitrosopumilus sp.]MDC0329944.1 hypothetical protein [Nitrosopumilus sp.]